MHWGTIEFAEGCRTSCGRFCGTEVGAWTENDLGGIAGGGPLTVLVVEVWDCTLGGSCGSLSFTCSVEDNVLDVMLEVLWRMADFAFDIDCAIELCAAFDWGWAFEMFAMGFCNSSMWDVAWFCDGFTGTLLDTWTGCCWRFEVSVKKKKLWMLSRLYKVCKYCNSKFVKSYVTENSLSHRLGWSKIKTFTQIYLREYRKILLIFV